MQMDQIGSGISRRRKQLGLSQEELAKQIGVTRQAVSKWESGAALPSVDNIVELARALEISVDELLQLEKTERQPGLSAESVGLLLDEQSARQEKRMKRLSWALIAAAAVLAAAIAVTSVLGMQRSSRMEENLNSRIASTNAQLNVQISGIQANVANTVKQALDAGSSRLADFGFHGYEYNHEERTVEMRAFAYPKELGEYADAEFYALVNGGTRASVPAERTSAGFEGTLSIPASDGDYMYVDGYVSWNEDGQTVTEKIFGWDLWMSDMRMTLGGAGMHYIHNDADGKTVVSPYVDVITSDLSPETYPAKALFEIYVSSELKASVGMPCEFEDGLVHCRLSPEEEVVLDGVFPLEELSMRVTVTDRRGNEFEQTWLYSEDE